MLPKARDLDPETKELIISLLPRTGADFVRKIGFKSAIDLFNEFGGTTWQFSRRASGNAIAAKRFQEMADVVGEDNALRLADEFGYDSIYIPSCKRAMDALRKRLIVAEFDEMTKVISVREATNQLVRRYRISHSAINRCVNAGALPNRAKTNP